MSNSFVNIIKILIILALTFSLSFATTVTLDAAGPTLTLSPTSGPIGTKVSVSFCDKDLAGRTIGIGNITFDGMPMNNRVIQLDSDGCLCATYFTVPYVDLVNGFGTPLDAESFTVEVKVSGVGPQDQPSTKPFTVTRPGLILSAYSGYKGGTVTVSGTGWPQRTPGAVTVTIEGAGTAIKKNATPDSSGAFSISYTAPPTDDAYFQDVGADCDRYLQVWAQDILGNVAPKPTNKRKFCLKAAYLTLDPKSGPPGTSVKVTGAGFQPQTSVEDLKIANTMIFAPNLMTNTVGTFTTTFPAPTLPLGCQVVSATVAGLTLGECFTITEPSLWGALDGELEIPVEDALATISDKLIRVWGYYNGEWRVYDPNDPLGSNLTGLISGRAYWIKLSEDCTLIFRQLKAGWNNIGW